MAHERHPAIADRFGHQRPRSRAPIRFVFSSCREPYGELSDGGIACSPADLAAAAANGLFLARLDIVDGSIATITQVFQSWPGRRC